MQHCGHALVFAQHPLLPGLEPSLHLAVLAGVLEPEPPDVGVGGGGEGAGGGGDGGGDDVTGASPIHIPAGWR